MKLWRCWAIFVVQVLVGCTPNLMPKTPQNYSRPIQFATYRFPKYAEEDANQNGVELSLKGIYAIDRDILFLFGNLGISKAIDIHRSLLLRSIDGGQHWEEVEFAPKGNSSVYETAFVDNGYGWALSALDVEDFTAGDLYRSKDYGKTWGKPIAIGEWGFHPWGIKFTDMNNGEIRFDKFTANPYSDRFGIITTSDGGMTWKETVTIPLSWGDKDGFEKVKKQYSEPPGGSYGSFWIDWSMSDVQHAKAHDGTEWQLHWDRSSNQYIVEWRSGSQNPWAVATALRKNFNYANGKITTP